MGLNPQIVLIEDTLGNLFHKAIYSLKRYYTQSECLLVTFVAKSNACTAYIIDFVLFSLLTYVHQNSKETSFAKFRRWWKGVNVFEKAYILLPIHEE
jgi:hypothetical protein